MMVSQTTPLSISEVEPDESLQLHLLQIIVNNAGLLARPSPSSSPPACPPAPSSLSMSPPPTIHYSIPHSSLPSSLDFHTSTPPSKSLVALSPTSPSSSLYNDSFLPADAFMSMVPFSLEEEDKTYAPIVQHQQQQQAQAPQEPDFKLPLFTKLLDFTQSHMSIWSRKTFQNLYANASLIKHHAKQHKLSVEDIKSMSFFDLEARRKHKHCLAPLIKTMFYTVIDPTECGKEPILKKFHLKIYFSGYHNGTTRKMKIINFMVEKDYFMYERSKHYLPESMGQKEAFVKEYQVDDAEVQRNAYKMDEKAIRASILRVMAYIETQRSRTLELRN